MAPFNSNKEKVKKQVAIDDRSLNLMMVLVAAIVALLIMTGVYFLVTGLTSPNSPSGGGSKPTSGNADYPFRHDITVNMSYDTENADAISGISSQHAVLVDITSGEIIAGKGSGSEIHPASMTKVMTLVVIFENLKSEDSLNDMVTVTEEHISNKTNDRKVSGYIGGPSYPAGQYSVRSLIYHLILNSDGVAALALADYIAGSEANFVKLMNDKAAELQLEKTNFVYCDGSHSIGHITTCRDMAKIMAYAMKNPHCAEVLTSFSYTSDEGVAECYHGLLVSLLHNDTPATQVYIKTADIIAGKTGWTGNVAEGESGGCIVSYAEGTNGKKYIVVVAGAPGDNFTYEAAPKAVQDTVTILNDYVK